MPRVELIMTTNRLTIVGPASDLNEFDAACTWPDEVEHPELLERSPGRHVWQFESEGPPLPWLRRISREWSSLTFLLDHEDEELRIKGLAKFKAGKVRSHRIQY